MANPTPTIDSMVVLGREEIRRRFARDVRIRQTTVDPTNPIDVGPNTLVDILASGVADALSPVYGNSEILATATTIRGTFGTNLDAIGQEMGRLRGGATPATGYVQISALPGGGQLKSGDVLTHKPTGISATVVIGQLYQNGDLVEIITTDTGPSTNLPAGSVMEFQNQKPGILLQAPVWLANDGSGLSGGHDPETDAEYQDALIALQSNPPAAGNTAQLIQAVMSTPAVPIQQAFVVSAWAGPGTTTAFFVTRPDAVTGSRIPNGVQMALVQTWLESSFPSDDSYTVAFVVSSPLAVAVGVTWRSNTPNWTDATQFPLYVAGDPVLVDAAVTPTTTTLRATTGTSTSTPQVGQTLALYDVKSGRFWRKRIAAVSVVVANKSWDLTFETASNASDPYVPKTGTLISPWSDSLNALPSQLAAYLRKLGPGEMFSSFPDPGLRRRRYPLNSPQSYPSIIYNADLINAIRASGATDDEEALMPTTPHQVAVGSPGVSINLFELGDFAVFPQT